MCKHHLARWESLLPSGIFCLLIALVAVGCAEADRPVGLDATRQTYKGSGLKPGDLIPDFGFLDAEGRPVHLGAVRGRVTVIVFPSDTEDWPSPQRYRALAKLAAETSGQDVPVVIVDVGQPKKTWKEAAKVLETEPIKSNVLVMVADREGSIHLRFSPNAMGRFYVVDTYLRIEEVGQFSGVESLRDPIIRAVRKQEAIDVDFNYHD
jgi:hypothetical protein